MAEKLPKIDELRNSPEADLLGQMDSLRQELWESRLKAGTIQQPHRLGALRKQIARIQTVLREQKKHS